MPRQNVEKQKVIREGNKMPPCSARILVDHFLMPNETKLQAGGVTDTSLCVLNYASSNEL